MNVNDLKLRLHLRAVLRSSQGVAFGGACCAECEEHGTSCGGGEEVVSFGTDVPKAPPPPQMKAPYSADQLLAYAKYVDDRAQALARTYSTLWTDPSAQWWAATDICNSASPAYDSAKATQILTGGPPGGDPGYANYVIQNCQPDFWKNQQATSSWAAQVPRGGWAGWLTYWNSYYSKMQSNLSVAGYFTGSTFDQIQQFHKELIWMCGLATQMKLPLVPDPGPLVTPQGIGEQVGGALGGGVTGTVQGIVDSVGGLLLLAGGIYVGAKLLTSRSR